MQISVDLRDSPASLQLHEADDFTAFKVSAIRNDHDPAVSEALAAAGLAPAGTEDHVYITAEAVRGLAGSLTADQAWCQSFEAMVQYASTKGWLGPHGEIRAHIEWVDAEADRR